MYPLPRHHRKTVSFLSMPSPTATMGLAAFADDQERQPLPDFPAADLADPILPFRAGPTPGVTMSLIPGLISLERAKIAEPGPPPSSEAVRQLLDVLEKDSDRNTFKTLTTEEALSAALSARDRAREEKDTAGEARAEQWRAVVFLRDKRVSEGRAARGAAARAWAAAGYTPGQLVQTGRWIFLTPESETAEAVLPRIREAAAIVRAETKRPYATAFAALLIAHPATVRPVTRAAALDLQAAAIKALTKVPESVLLAHVLTSRAALLLENFAIKESISLAERALKIFDRFGILTLETEECLTILATAALTQADLAALERYNQRRIAILEKVAPASLMLVVVLTQQAGMYHGRGDLVAAEPYATRAQALFPKLDPAALAPEREVTNDMMGINSLVLGDCAFRRGDLARAQSAYQDARQYFAGGKVDPNYRAALLSKLANLAFARGDLVTADAAYREAEKLYGGSAMARQVSNGEELADLRVNRASVAARRGDLAGAEALLVRAKIYYDAQAKAQADEPRFHLRSAECLQRLGTVSYYRSLAQVEHASRKQGLRTALSRFLAADAILRQVLKKNAHGNLEFAVEYAAILGGRATIRAALGDWPGTEEDTRAALLLLERAAPASLEYATALGNWGQCLVRRGAGARAIPLLEKGVAMVERQRASVPQSARRALTLANQQDLYGALLEAQAQAGDVEAAFHTLERSRARDLADQIAERDADAAAEVPPSLRKHWDDLEAVRAGLYERLPGASAEKAREVRAKINALGIEESTLIAEIRRQSRRYTELRYPESLTLSQVHKSLPAGTLLLAYFVAREKVHIFTVKAGVSARLRHHAVPLSEQSLVRMVSTYRDAIASRGNLNMAKRQPLPVSLGRDLFRLLIGPVHEQVTAAARVLLCLDGPLHTLPFAALIGPGTMEGGISYPLAQKPLSLIPSATLYARLRSQSRPAPSAPIVAFGDPRQTRLARLPQARAEAAQVAAKFGATPFVDADATERRFYEKAPAARLLHLACHAVCDRDSPLGSYLLLTAGGGADGVIFAHDLYAGKLRLTADLVTLSACDTGTGWTVRFEGASSMARAFLYTGARAVLQTLWPANDQAARVQMNAFYGAASRQYDEALCQSARELRNISAYSHPYYWANFQLFGDPGP